MVQETHNTAKLSEQQQRQCQRVMELAFGKEERGTVSVLRTDSSFRERRTKARRMDFKSLNLNIFDQPNNYWIGKPRHTSHVMS